MKKKNGSLSSCKSWGIEYNLLEAKPTLLEMSYSRYGCRGFLVHFNYHALLFSFLLVFGCCLLVAVDIKRHRIVLLNLIVCILALFWFIFWYLWFHVKIICIICIWVHIWTWCLRIMLLLYVGFTCP